MVLPYFVNFFTFFEINCPTLYRDLRLITSVKNDPIADVFMLTLSKAFRISFKRMPKD